MVYTYVKYFALGPEDPDLIVPGNEEIDVQQIHETSLDRYDSCYISNGSCGDGFIKSLEAHIFLPRSVMRRQIG